MKKTILLILLMVFCLPSVASTEGYPVVYRISNYYDTSLKVKVDVVTKHLGTFILTNSKTSLSKVPQPRKQVYCADNNSLVEYNRAQRCSSIYWFIDLKRQPMEGINGAGQDDYYLNNGQWLITEAYNFPRFHNISKALVCVNDKTCQPIPADGLPLFFIWGKKPTPIKLPSLTVNIFTDRQGDTLLDKQKLVKWLEPRYEYIAKVFHTNNDYPINVIWLARNANAKVSGGLAGYHSFLANYYVENNQLVKNTETILLHTSLHEYVHVASPYRYATWIEESLAEYYANKAVTLGEFNTNSLERWQKIASAHPSFSAGLYEANQKLLKGAVSYYSVLYIKGSAFWNEIDQHLLQHNTSLDQFIPYLAGTNDNVELPKVFIDKVEPIIGKDILDQLIQQYLR